MNDTINAWKPWVEREQQKKENENISDLLCKIADDCGFKLCKEKTGIFDGRLRIVHDGAYTIEQRLLFYQRAISLAVFELDEG